MCVEHNTSCVSFRRLNPLKVASPVVCVMYTKYPQPRIKRDGLLRTGGKGNRKYQIDLPTHLGHRCALTLLKWRKIISKYFISKKNDFTCFILLNV